jgi:poly-beta-1,6-N-acetyl-D-glucosamine synthase
MHSSYLRHEPDRSLPGRPAPRSLGLLVLILLCLGFGGWSTEARASSQTPAVSVMPLDPMPISAGTVGEPEDGDPALPPESEAPGTARQVTVTVLLVVFTIGLNFFIWGSIGIARLVDEKAGQRRGGPPRFGPPKSRVERRHLAIVMAAHNEAAVIVDALRAVRELVPRSNVYVASDGSTDATTALAREVGVNVLDLVANRGKAGALLAALEHFRLLDRYRAVLFVDADTHLDPGYLDAALPWFNDPKVAAVAGYAKPIWRPGGRSLMANMLAAHRHRLYAVTQMLQKYGQTWRFTNVAYIVPGFASVYRTSVLRHMDLDPPGLVIEDFNMTFEIHHHHLGRIAFTPDALARCHEPSTYAEYVSQMRRWVLGFWQTVRRHGVWVSAFWAALALWIAEVVLASLVFSALPLIVAVLVLPELWAGALQWGWFTAVFDVVSSWVTLPVILLGVLVPDLVITTVLGAKERRWRYPLLALGFPLLRITDAVIGLITIPRAWTETSTGAWRSPTRR